METNEFAKLIAARISGMVVGWYIGQIIWRPVFKDKLIKI